MFTERAETTDVIPTIKTRKSIYNLKFCFLSIFPCKIHIPKYAEDKSHKDNHVKVSVKEGFNPGQVTGRYRLLPPLPDHLPEP